MQFTAFKNHATYRREAEAFVRRYDRNGDQAIDRSEAGRDRFVDRDILTTTSRISSTHVVATTTEVERFARVELDAWRRADLNGDGRLTAGEMLEEYADQRDRNGNNDLGFWERFGMGIGDMVSRLEAFSRSERVLGRNLVYSPIPDYEYDRDRPAPPRPDYDRPTPPRPNYDRPAPPRPDASRPTPPRPDFDRPAPPRPDASRPTPPRPDFDRPTPPRPDASRPTPPRPDFDRPTPPPSTGTRPPRPDFDRPSPPPSSGTRPPRPDFDRPSPPDVL